MKTISIVVPCYNEEENVEALYQAITGTFHKELPDYCYEIIFIDNDSKDRTRDIVRSLQSGSGSKGHFQCQELWSVQFPLLRHAPIHWRCHHPYGG